MLVMGQDACWNRCRQGRSFLCLGECRRLPPAMGTRIVLLTIITAPSQCRFRWIEWRKRKTVTLLIVVLILYYYLKWFVLNCAKYSDQMSEMNSFRLNWVLSRIICCYFDLFIHVKSIALSVNRHQGVQAKGTCSNLSLPVVLDS